MIGVRQGIYRFALRVDYGKLATPKEKSTKEFE